MRDLSTKPFKPSWRHYPNVPPQRILPWKIYTQKDSTMFYTSKGSSKASMFEQKEDAKLYTYIYISIYIYMSVYIMTCKLTLYTLYHQTIISFNTSIDLKIFLQYIFIYLLIGFCLYSYFVEISTQYNRIIGCSDSSKSNEMSVMSFINLLKSSLRCNECHCLCTQLQSPNQVVKSHLVNLTFLTLPYLKIKICIPCVTDSLLFFHWFSHDST